MARLLIPLFLVLFAALPANSQERPSVMLVLDASGSMWGQIDGVAKIVIARQVVSGLLDDIPASQSLGLTVYGHRVEGNCADIETLVAPAVGSNEAIRQAVNALKPKGRTPLSDAILIAADVLNFTEAPATVILVTDGVENCDRDPCALAQSLEKAGVDFTAHVIGFDVSEIETPELQCLADTTGGKFLTAESADELSAALGSVAQAPVNAPPEPEPMQAPKREPITAQFDSKDANGIIFGTLEWSIYGPDGPVVEGHRQNQIVIELTKGLEYLVQARKPRTGETVEITVVPTGEGFTFTRQLVFP